MNLLGRFNQQNVRLYWALAPSYKVERTVSRKHVLATLTVLDCVFEASLLRKGFPHSSVSLHQFYLPPLSAQSAPATDLGVCDTETLILKTVAKRLLWPLLQ